MGLLRPIPAGAITSLIDGKGHLLWNAGKVVTQYLEDHAQDLVVDKDVLELGAGAGLPSVVCALRGARTVVVADYPDVDLVQNLQHNINTCGDIPSTTSIEARGYLWGNDTTVLTANLKDPAVGFDLLILADVLFNHSEHHKLAATVQATLKKQPHARALVFFTPYRPWLLEKDLVFFDVARAGGLKVEKLFEQIMDKVMFEDDPGDEMLRRTVFAYDVRWPTD